MQVLTFDEILTKMCDIFDSLIVPSKISRSNTNIVYLIFKAIAKGFELVNNICVVLSNKFNPANCSDEDLVSVASLVGTERRAGSATGLHIFVTNTGSTDIVLLAGVYTYKLDEETSFEFEVISDTTIAGEASVSYIAMSDKIGQFPVTAQQSIEVTSIRAIPEKCSFSCSDNSGLLGREEESLLAFRKRVLTTYDRQNTMVELEEYLRNLPYVFDCNVRYNQTDSDLTVGSVTVPPMTCAIFLSGEIKNELAEKVADYIVCPTVSTQNSVEVRYNNSVFADGYYAVNIIPFATMEFTVDVIYKVNDEFTSVQTAKENIKKSLMSNFTGELYVPTIKENDIYNIIENAGDTGIDTMAVNLKVNGAYVEYINVPADKIAVLASVNFVEG